jgi:hypothetical protein
MNLKDTFVNSIQLMIDTFVVAIPNLIKAMAIFIIGYYISKSIFKFVNIILVKSGIDKFGEKLNEIDFVEKMNLEIKFSFIIAKIIFYFLILIFVVAATDVLGMLALSGLVAGAIAFVPNLVVALAILIAGILGADLLRKIALTSYDTLGILNGKMIANFMFYFAFITVSLMALCQAKINTEFLATNISIVIGGAVLAFSIEYGYASKDVISNFFASRYSQSKIKVRDVIAFEGIKGTVSDLDRSSLEITTHYGKYIFPISKLLKSNFKIYS